MLEEGVAPEQARMVLPQSMYTEVIATGNLYAWANMYIQRSDSHAQKETQDLAKQIGEIIQPLYPVSWAALGVFVAPVFMLTPCVCSTSLPMATGTFAATLVPPDRNGG